MRPYLIGLSLLCGPAFAFVACGQEPTGSTTATSGTGGAPNCDGVNIVFDDVDGGHPCDICMHEHCCAELSFCRDQACIDCVNILLPDCGLRPHAASDCSDLYCADTCSPMHNHSTTSTGTSGTGG